MPNRLIKDSICASESIDHLTAFQETVFYRLIVNCDDYGRMDARPDILSSKLFPLRRSMPSKKMQDAIQALEKESMVTIYEVDGKPYLQMTSWTKHQQIRAKKSKYPPPDGTCNQMISGVSKCPRNPIQSNPIRIQSESNTTTPGTSAHVREEEPEPENDLGRVMTFFLDKVNPSPSPIAIGEIQYFLKQADLDADVIIHAMQLAVDEKKTGWSYIKAILQRYASSGLNRLPLVFASEEDYQAKKGGTKNGHDRSSGKPENEARPEYNVSYAVEE